MNFPVLLKHLRPAPRRSRRSGRAPVPLRVEVRRGAMVGGCSGFVWAVMLGGSFWLALCAAAGCGTVGALLGVLLWSGSEAIPEDPVVPAVRSSPGREQDRS